MPADIDVLVGGRSSIGYAPGYQFKSDVHRCGDFLGSSPNSYLSTSPRIFGNSPPTHFTFHGRCSSPSLRSVSTSSSIGLTKNFGHLRLSSSESCKMPVAVPRRPCLVVRCDALDLPSANRSKKKVVFADDRGFPLTLVRTMSEPSNVPPRLSLQVLTKANQETQSKPATEPWEVTFPQPASDYLDFRRRLDTNNVCLENVIVKEVERVVVGTVKVRNLTYHKQVFIRTTSDGWKTQADATCSYIPNSPPAHGVTVLYDTFSLRLTLPPTSNRLEFCVGFRCSDGEFWDNNNGKNYTLVKREQETKRSDTSDSSPVQLIHLPRKFSDEVKPNTQLESWSEFASWNHLNNNTPYW